MCGRLDSVGKPSQHRTGEATELLLLAIYATFSRTTRLKLTTVNGCVCAHTHRARAEKTYKRVGLGPATYCYCIRVEHTLDISHIITIAGPPTNSLSHLITV